MNFIQVNSNNEFHSSHRFPFIRQKSKVCAHQSEGVLLIKQQTRFTLLLFLSNSCSCVGIVLASLSSGFGEITFMALSSYYHKYANTFPGSLSLSLSLSLNHIPLSPSDYSHSPRHTTHSRTSSPSPFLSPSHVQEHCVSLQQRHRRRGHLREYGVPPPALGRRHHRQGHTPHHLAAHTVHAPKVQRKSGNREHNK